MKLSHNKILITGASKGIGRVLAARFSALGNTIIALGRNEESLAELAASDPNIIPFICDIARPAELAKLSAFIERHHRDLNILINNAAIQYNYNFMESPEDVLHKIDEEVSTNLMAPLKLIALLLPILKSNPQAALVNISSGLALVPKSQAPVYCATKAGIHIFSQSLRTQLDGVKVFEIIPPMVNTAMTEGRGKGKMAPEQLVDEFIRAFKKNRYEVSIGKVKWLKIIHRIYPGLAHKIIQKGSKNNQ